MRTSIPAAVLLVLAACGFRESNALDLSPVDGSPVELKNVRMAESLASSLGGGGSVKFSSTDKANAIGVAYDVHVVAAAASYSGVSGQLACRVGEHTVVSTLATDASDRLSKSAIGTKLDERDVFMPMAFSNGIPTRCEASLYYTIAPPLPSVPSPGAAPAPEPDFLRLGTVCFVDGELREGACSADELPRTPAATPIEASRMLGRIGEIAGQGDRAAGFGVGISLLVTAGNGVPQNFLVGADATCEQEGRTRDIPLGLLMTGRRLQPGESIVQSSATPAQSALPQAPQWCTVHVALADHGTKRPLADFCVRGEAVTDGACTP